MSSPDRERLRAVLEETMASGAVTAAGGQVHELFPVAIPQAEGEALRDLVLARGAARTIETELGYGVSALYVCAGLQAAGHRDATHVAIDPYQRKRFGDVGLNLLQRAGVSDMVEHIPRPSEIALPALLDEGRRFDLAVIDGNHRFDGVFVDLFYRVRLLEPGSPVFLDDYQLPGVRRAAAFVADLGCTLDTVSQPDDEHQWAVLTTSREPDKRPYDFFADF